jgi:sialic acid synthase
MGEAYIIGEIGQNHNGSVDIAKVIIDIATRETFDDAGHALKGIDAIKLTKRDLREELSVSQMNAPYHSPHAFGKTYGEHRRALELSDEQHLELFTYSKAKHIDLVETICARGALSLLKLFTPDKLKVASRDMTNTPLLEAMAETGIPMIVSTGMSGKKELDDALNVITKYHHDIAILHCVSQYPTEPHNVNLNSITYLLRHYPEYTIGYSDHTIGITMPLAAVAMGATIIEKHITIDRGMKGTDQAGSLGPDGIKRMIRDLRLLALSMGKEALFIDPAVQNSSLKLERSIAAARTMTAGEIITLRDIHLLSPGDGYKWFDKDRVIGKTLLRDIAQDEILYKHFIGGEGG